MEHDNSHITKRHHFMSSSDSKRSKLHKQDHESNKEHRIRSEKRENFPNGYLETWLIPKTLEKNSKDFKKHKSPLVSKRSHDTSHERDLFILSERETPKLNTTHSKSEKSKFTPVSMNLLVTNNLILNKDNNYEIRFNTGVREGPGIDVNERGNIITFSNDGSYQFEICGEATPFSNVDVSLIYDSSKFTQDIKPFAFTKIPKQENMIYLRGISTILPIQKGQNIVVKLIATPDESIILLEGTRLLIHRVA